MLQMPVYLSGCIPGALALVVLSRLEYLSFNLDPREVDPYLLAGVVPNESDNNVEYTAVTSNLMSTSKCATFIMRFLRVGA
jgi:hypothetical protein